VSAAAERLSGTRKAAVLLAVLGEEAAGAVLRHLGEKEIQTIAEELITIDNVPPEVAEEVLEEFYRTAGADAPKT
jgi:flagellar motor switch protein FliG